MVVYIIKGVGMDSNQAGFDFYTGAPVDDEHLWFRDPFIEQVWEKLRTQHVLITAPRRTGKTSVMFHMLSRPRADYLVIYQNVQDFKHPAQLFQTVIENFHEKHPQLLQQLAAKGYKFLEQTWSNLMRRLENVEAGGVKIALRESDPNWEVNWKRHAEDLLNQIRSVGKPILLIVDELPDMILNMKPDHSAEAREFLAWFRTQRQNPQPSKDCIRWLCGGSINLAGTLDDLGRVDLINDLSVEELPVFTPEQVEEFVATMLSSRGVALDDSVPRRMVEQLGRPIPFFLQLATQNLHRHWQKVQRKLIPNDVDFIFKELIARPSAREQLQHYYSRIRTYYTEPRQTAAYQLLALISQSGPEGLSRKGLKTSFEQSLAESDLKLTKAERDNQFSKLLRDLENDFYICEVAEDQYDFASGLLKSWWRRNYG